MIARVFLFSIIDNDSKILENYEEPLRSNAFKNAKEEEKEQKTVILLSGIMQAYIFLINANQMIITYENMRKNLKYVAKYSKMHII